MEFFKKMVELNVTKFVSIWKKFIEKNAKQFLAKMSSKTVKLISWKYFA